MKKILTSVCLAALMGSLVMSGAVFGGYKDTYNPNYTGSNNATGSSVQYEKNVQDNSVASSGEPTPVTVKADDGLDYSDGSGSKGTKAAYADTALTAGSMAVQLTANIIAWYTANKAQMAATSEAESAAASAPSFWPILISDTWFPIDLSISNWFEWAIQLGHAAVNQFMRDETYITASFTGAQGHVTDKWVGPPAKNKTFKILGEFNVPTQRFAAIAFDEENYKGLENVDEASARDLMNYRNDKLVEEQRSLENVTQETWGLRYRAQQRSITAMATALQLKETLAALAEADSRVSGEYGSKTQAVASVAARRVLYDALMFLKMNVMAARTKMRSEALELDFKPVTTAPAEIAPAVESGVAK